MIPGTYLARLGTLVGTMRRRAWLSVVVISVCAAACGVLPGSTPGPTATAVGGPAPAAAAASPSPAQAAASPSPSPPAAAVTAAPPAATAQSAGGGNAVYVGNTDGEGVFLRKTPNMDDHLQAYPDGTQLTIVGDDVEGDGQTWKHVRAPDGTEGYVPAQYTTSTPG